MSAVRGVAVTPSDSATIPPTKGIYVGTAGNLAVTFPDGSVVTFTGIATGIVHPLCVTKVMATNTTASTIVAVY